VSRAFVKEDAQGPDEDPPERPLSDQPNYCTPRGIRLYQDEEARLLKELEPFAGAQDDAKKKRRKRELERDLRWVRARLESVIPVDPANQPKDQIRFGARAVLKGQSGERAVRIVGEDEAEEGGEYLSYAAPFAQALLGLKAGQSADWSGETWTVESIAYSA
jgi:transcription elongation GreA/GreB family factor